MQRLTKFEKTKIFKLAREGISLNKISEITKKSKSTLYYHISHLVRKNSVVDIKRLTEWERGYLLGVFFGDGHLDFREKTYSYRVVFSLNKKGEQKIANRILSILKKAGGKPYIVLFKNPRNKNLLRIVCVSKNLYEFCKNNVVYKIKAEFRGMKNVRKKSHLKNIDFNSDFIYGFIGGLIDSDGYISNDLTTTISTSSAKFVTQLSQIFKKIGLKISVYFNKKVDSYTLRIKTADYRKVIKSVKAIKGPVV